MSSKYKVYRHHDKFRHVAHAGMELNNETRDVHQICLGNKILVAKKEKSLGEMLLALLLVIKTLK